MGDGNGVLSVEDIAAHYDVSKHPDVLSGKTDAKTALRSFLDGLDAKAGNQVITVQEWMDHFAGVSASIDSDDQFGAMMAKTWGHLKVAASGKEKPAISPFVSRHEVDRLEKMLYEATYRRKSGSHHAQQRLINETFKIFDTDGSGNVDRVGFLNAMERFGLHVRGKGRPGVGGLAEDVVLALFDRYDVERSGTLSFREFTTAYLSRHQEVSEPMSADEYKRQPKKYAATFAGEAIDDSELIHLKARRDPELVSARQPQLIGSNGCAGYLSAAARVHGSMKGKKSSAATPFR